MEPKSEQPIVSTYVHVPPTARISHVIDSSSFGVSASIRIGAYGENDASLFFRSPEQLEKLAEEAARAAKWMRNAVSLRAQIQAAAE